MFTTLKKYISKQFIFPKVHIPASNDLSGTVALVTGAGRGIGKAICETILKKGGKVVAVSRSRANLEDAFPGANDSLMLFEGDVTSEKDARECTDLAEKRFGALTVLINNAGVNIEKPLEEIKLSEYKNIVDINMMGVFLMSKYAIPIMKKQGDGLILTIGSKISHNTKVGPNKVLYAMTKHAIEGFSFALNRELKSAGIRVSCLAPGTVNTFASTKAKEFLSPYHVAEMVATIIRLRDIDFESVVFKHKKQGI